MIYRLCSPRLPHRQNQRKGFKALGTARAPACKARSAFGIIGSMRKTGCQNRRGELPLAVDGVTNLEEAREMATSKRHHLVATGRAWEIAPSHVAAK